jgi:photosystem II stability/assembly factor-like uncharacterized protein
MLIFYFLTTDLIVAQWKPIYGPPGGRIWSLNKNINGIIFAGSNNGLYRSTDGGNQWLICPVPLVTYFVIATNSKGNVFVTGGNSIYRTTDDGYTWNKIVLNNIQPYWITNDNKDNIFISSSKGIYQSSDNGNNWVVKDSLAHQNRSIYFLESIREGYLYGAGYDSGVYFSSDNGSTWKQILNDVHILGLHISENNKLYVGTNTGIYRASEPDYLWEKTNTGLKDTAVWTIHSGHNTAIFAATNGGIYSSTNQGNSWEKSNFDSLNRFTLSVYNDSNNVIAGTYFDGIYQSHDTGVSWKRNNNGLANTFVKSIAFSSKGTIISVDHQIHISTDYSKSWVMKSLSENTFYSIAINKHDSIYIGSGHGIFISTDLGESWINIGLKNLDVYSITIRSDGTIYAVASGGVFYSTNGGESWTQSINIKYVNSLYVDTKGVLWASSISGILNSTDNGVHWTNIGLQDYNIQSFVIASDGSFIAGANAGGFENFYGGIYKSTNNGAFWKKVNTNYSNSLLVSQNNWIIGNTNVGLQYSTDNGDSWNNYDSSLTSVPYCLALSPDNYMYVGTNGGGIYKTTYTLSDVILQDKTDIKTFVLNNNYPNPFNSETTISFQLATQNYTTLKIYDIMGREVLTLLSDILPAGNYTKRWNALNYSTGIYYYQLRSNKFVETKKLLLLK